MIFHKNKPQSAHLLKPSHHDNFSQDPDLALIFLDFSSQDTYQNTLTQTLTQALKKLEIKKKYFLFFNKNFQEKNTHPSKFINHISDQIMALTERPGGFILRGQSGNNYHAKACLIISAQAISLRQSSDLLIQNLDTQGYLIPENLNLINSSPKISENFQSLSLHPRIQEKLFFWELKLSPETLTLESRAFLEPLFLKLFKTLWA